MTGMKLFLICLGIVRLSLSLSVEDEHLVRCLTNISVRYFAPGRTVVMDVPAGDEAEVQTELATKLNQMQMWPIIVHKYEVEYKDSSETELRGGKKLRQIIDPLGSFLLFLSFSCTDDNAFMTDFDKKIEFLYNFWDPFWSTDSPFVVVLTLKCEIGSGILYYILDYLLRVKITRSIVLQQKKFQSSPDSPHTAGYSPIEIYAHFQYKTPGNCHEIKNLFLLDTWVMREGGHFRRNINLYRQRSYENLHGCPIRAIVNLHDVAAFAKRSNSNPKRILQARGFEVELFRLITKAMNATAQFNGIMESRNVYNSTVEEAVRKLAHNEADVIFGSLNVGNLQSTTNNWVILRWYVPCRIQSSRLTRIFKIFSVTLWLVTALTLILASIVMVKLAKNAPPGTSEWSVYKNIGSSLTAVWSVLMGVSVSVMPRTAPLRVFFSSCVIFCLAFSTVMLCYLTTYMIEPGFEPDIEDMEQLMTTDLAFCVPEVYRATYDYIDTEFSGAISGRKVVCFLDDCIKWGSLYRNCSVLASEEDVSQRTMASVLTDENKLCTLEDGVMAKYPTGMLFMPRDPLFYQVKKITTLLKEAGIIRKTEELYWHIWKISKFEIEQSSNYHDYNTKDLSPPFFLLFFGLGLSVFTLLLELLCHKYQENISKVIQMLKSLCNMGNCVHFLKK